MNTILNPPLDYGHARTIIEGVGRAHSKDKINIRFLANLCQTDGNDIILPAMPSKVKRPLVDMMIANVEHEAAHIRFSDFPSIIEARKKYGNAFTEIHGWFEDIYIEELAKQERPAMEMYFVKDKILGIRKRIADIKKGNRALGSVIRGELELMYFHADRYFNEESIAYSDEMKELLKYMPPESWTNFEKHKGFVDRAKRCRNSKQVIQLALDFIAQVKSEAEEREENSLKKSKKGQKIKPPDENPNWDAQKAQKDKNDQQDEDDEDESKEGWGQEPDIKFKDEEQEKQSNKGEVDEEDKDDSDNDGDDGESPSGEEDSDDQGGSDGDDSEEDKNSSEDQPDESGLKELDDDSQELQQPNPSGSSGSSESDEDDDESESESGKGPDDGEKDPVDGKHGKKSGDHEEDALNTAGASKTALDEIKDMDASTVAPDGSGAQHTRSKAIKDMMAQEIKEQGEVVDAYGMNSTAYSITYNKTDLAVAGKYEQEMRLQADSLRTKLMMTLLSKGKRRYIQDREEGEIDLSRVGMLYAGASTRVFKQKIESTRINTAAILLCDGSGSMSDKRELMLKTCVAFCDALETCKVKTMVTMFTDYFSEGQKMDLVEPQYGIVQGISYETCGLHVAKDFDEGYQAAKAKIATFETKSGTPMGAAIRGCLPIFRARKEKRRIIFCLTDGDANDNSTVYSALKTAKQEKIEVYGIGIGCFPSVFPKDQAITLTNMSNWHTTFLGEVTKIIMNGYQEHLQRR